MTANINLRCGGPGYKKIILASHSRIPIHKSGFTVDFLSLVLTMMLTSLSQSLRKWGFNCFLTLFMNLTFVLPTLNTVALPSMALLDVNIHHLT